MRNFFSNLKAAATAWQADKAPRLAAALAYYAVLSLAPLCFTLLAILGLAYRDEVARASLASSLGEAVGTDGARLIEGMLAAASSADTGLAVALGTAIAIFGAAGIVLQLKDSLDTIFGPSRTLTTGIKAKALSYATAFLLLIVGGVTLIASLVLSGLVASLAERISMFVALPPVTFEALHAALLLTLSSCLLALAFRILPANPPTWKTALGSALLTSVLLVAGKVVVSLYLGRGGATSAFGAAGSLVALLIWIYYSAQIFLFGAEFAKAASNPPVAAVRVTGTKNAHALRLATLLGAAALARVISRKKRPAHKK